MHIEYNSNVNRDDDSAVNNERSRLKRKRHPRLHRLDALDNCGVYVYEMEKQTTMYLIKYNVYIKHVATLLMNGRMIHYDEQHHTIR